MPLTRFGNGEAIALLLGQMPAERIATIERVADRLYQAGVPAASAAYHARRAQTFTCRFCRARVQADELLLHRRGDGRLLVGAFPATCVRCAGRAEVPVVTGYPEHQDVYERQLFGKGYRIVVNGTPLADLPLPAVQRYFEGLMGSARLAEMFETGVVPRAVTDDTRFNGWTNTGGAQFKSDVVRDGYLRPAREAGVDVTGKVYMGEIARFPGDPEAWVDTQGDIRRVVEGRGWGADGDLKVKKREFAPPAQPKLAADIVEERVADLVSERYGGDGADEIKVPAREVREMTEAVVAKHGRPAHLDG